MKRTIPVIIDTDPGVDDAVALILALRSPELKVLGITTVFGNVTVEKTTQNARRVLDMMGCPEHGPPVVRGSAGPLVRSFGESTQVHGRDGLGDTNLPESKRPLYGTDVVSFMLKKAHACAGGLHLITLGPLTNAARLVGAVEKPQDLIAHITVMGGAVTVPGNRTPVAETNILSDPEAAALVFRSGVPLTLIGLDVTHNAVFGEEELAVLSDAPEGSAGHFVQSVVAGYLDFYRKNRGLRGAALHDPLAVAVTIRPDLVRTERWHIDVETQGRLTTGMVVADRRFKPAAEANASVAVELDYPAFRDMLLQRLGNTP